MNRKHIEQKSHSILKLELRIGKGYEASNALWARIIACEVDRRYEG
jgi:hypothetical protein